MPTVDQSQTMRRFQDTRNMVAVILNNLAEVAEVRKVNAWTDTSTDSKRGGTNIRPLAELLRHRAERVASRSFFRLAVVGEFSRGKSTLINALLGQEILTSDFRPNTAALTVIKYAPNNRLRIVYKDELGREPIDTEPRNLRNELKNFTSDTAVSSDYKALIEGKGKSLGEEIESVQVWCNSEFLRSRELEILDTPGLGSIFPAHKKVTRSIVPNVDATLFLVQADPGLGESEVQFLRFVKEYVDQIFFVLTKADMARSKEELQQMSDFVKKTIEAQVGIDVINIFSVAALQQIQGKTKESGFGQFLPALEKFLINSTGLARVQIPFDFARTQWLRLYDAVERDYLAIDRDLNDFIGELKDLKREEVSITRMRDGLLSEVDRTIESLIRIATGGMNTLPILLRQEVETAIDKFSWEQLRKADIYIEPVIKEYLINWLKNKEKSFRSECEFLEEKVTGELKKILDTIKMENQIKDVKLSLTIFSPKMQGSFSGDVVRLFSISTATGLASFLIGIGISGIIGAITGVVTGGVTLIPILVGITGFAAPALNFTNTIKKRIKDNLARPIPNTTVNVYEAIINGYDQSGKHVEGIKERVENTFNYWGLEIKNNITDMVNNNLNTRLTLLERQIQEKEGGKTNREREYEKYSTQIQSLIDLASRLDKVEVLLQELGGEKGVLTENLASLIKQSPAYLSIKQRKS